MPQPASGVSPRAFQKATLTLKGMRAFLDDIEEDFLACWEGLTGMREPLPAEGWAKNFLEFQSTLAGALFALDTAYRDLHQEKQKLIRRKKTLQRPWFVRRMKTIRRYQKALTEMSSIGRSLGDSFAWFFYHSSPQLLHKHFEHE